jgi:hypothetical protein
MGTAFLIGAAALALGAVIVGLFLPARAHDHEGWDGVGPAGDGTGERADGASDRTDWADAADVDAEVAAAGAVARAPQPNGAEVPARALASSDPVPER